MKSIRLHFAISACIGVLGLVSSAMAQGVPTPPAGQAQGPELRSATQAAAPTVSPITLRLQYTGEAGENTMGGLKQGATYLNNILAQLHIDTGKAFGWTGGRFVLEGFYQNASSFNGSYVGAFQDPSAIDSDGVAIFRVYQAYYKQDIGATNVLFGIYDLESEFGITRPMDLFFNGAYAWTATLDTSGLNGPSTYPETTLAMRIRHTFSREWSVQAAVLNGVPESVKRPEINAININRTNGALLIGEVDYTPTRTTKVMAGYWDYTGKFDANNETDAVGNQRQVYGSSGAYIGGATRIYSPGPRRGLDVFANIGFGSARTQIIDRSFSAGLNFVGPLEFRPLDKLGFAVGVAQVGDAYRAGQAAAGTPVLRNETNFELTYRAPVTSWLVVQPDVQYWINPGADPRLKNDLLLLLHFEVSHVFNL